MPVPTIDSNTPSEGTAQLLEQYLSEFSRQIRDMLSREKALEGPLKDMPDWQVMWFRSNIDDIKEGLITQLKHDFSGRIGVNALHVHKASSTSDLPVSRSTDPAQEHPEVVHSASQIGTIHTLVEVPEVNSKEAPNNHTDSDVDVELTTSHPEKPLPITPTSFDRFVASFDRSDANSNSLDGSPYGRESPLPKVLSRALNPQRATSPLKLRKRTKVVPFPIQPPVPSKLRNVLYSMESNKSSGPSDNGVPQVNGQVERVNIRPGDIRGTVITANAPVESGNVVVSAGSEPANAAIANDEPAPQVSSSIDAPSSSASIRDAENDIASTQSLSGGTVDNDYTKDIAFATPRARLQSFNFLKSGEAPGTPLASAANRAERFLSTVQTPKSTPEVGLSRISLPIPSSTLDLNGFESE